METKEILSKMEELSFSDLIGIHNEFIMEIDTEYERYLYQFGELDEVTGLNGFTEALDDLGLSSVFPFEYYVDEIYYYDRFLKSEHEARIHIKSTFERNIDDYCIELKRVLKNNKNDNNKEVIECILSMI